MKVFLCGAFLCGFLHHSSSEDGENTNVFIETSQYKPVPWTIEKAITELGRKLTYEKVEPLKIHDFELLIRKAMYDIKLRVDLEKMEEHDPLLAFETDQVLDEARRIITKSFIDAKTKRGNIAAHFQYTVETAVNKVLETVSLDKDDDIEDFL